MRKNRIISIFVIFFIAIIIIFVFSSFSKTNTILLPMTKINPIPTNKTLEWGAYTGGVTELANFEALVGKKVNIYADFVGWDSPFPSDLSTTIGARGKTLLIFWEPSFGYDGIIDGSKDTYIQQFATDAKKYGYPVILAPFDEMNLNEEAWGYGKNNNTAEKFKTAWINIHGIFASVGATNVRFALTFNNVSTPDINGNWMKDYYPGDIYVDYIGIDGFNFNAPPLSFAQIFDAGIKNASVFKKPIYILSTASDAGPQKAQWIKDGLGTTVKNYPNVLGWVWFNKSGTPNWIVNSDNTSLTAFKSVLP
jgi:mannan endo-1,4-beta-mannosidase